MKNIFSYITIWINSLSTLFLSIIPDILTVFICSTLLCFIPKLEIWDIPQDRSAHTHPISKGGGIAIVCAFLFGAIAFYFCYSDVAIPSNPIYAFIGLFFIAIFSLLDDIKSQNVWLKLIVQITSAFLTMMSLKLNLPLIILISAISVIFLNTINFMDGLNGLASLSMIAISAFLLTASAPITICLPLLLALLSFLPWNFPKARIFMGDIGSQTCALILCLAAGCLISKNIHHPFDIRKIILLPALLNGMIFDVFLTLFFRSLKDESLTKAHNTHLYQLAARSKSISPIFITLVECSFVIGGGCVALYSPLPAILPLLLLPQIIWCLIVFHFWKISQRT